MNSKEIELQEIDHKLALLEKQREELIKKKQKIIQFLRKNNSTLSIFTPEEKINIFLDLFRGRADIFAIRWENKAGKSGYSVSCDNEWANNICKKPKVKCSECPNQAFKKLNSEAAYAHLTGKITVGLYPIELNNNCWFLAADFDKSDWKDAVSAYKKACDEMEISCYVEVSRSGNGAHIWIFFGGPILAKKARELGFYLLDKAMNYHSNLSFSSYDRLFPNQDNLPIGGFGNLIALPLQYNLRKFGKSVFVDDDFKPYFDQWSLLSSVKKIAESNVNNILEKQSISRLPGNREKPWERFNCNRPFETILGCPNEIFIVLASRIYIYIHELPQILIAKLKKLASFSNPVFFKTQALRFSTNGIPRFICLAEIDEDYLSLPRGCSDDVFNVLKEQKIKIQIEDKRENGRKLDNIIFNGKLRKDQLKAIDVLSKYDNGILHAPTAFGKTVTAIGLIHKRKTNTLILVHSRQLLDQWRERLNSFLTGVEIGIIGGGKRKPTYQVDVATYQSMIKKSDNTVLPEVYQYGQVIIDECHHISASNYEFLLNEVRSKFVVGVTATPTRQDGHQPIIFMQAGKIRHKIESDNAKFIQKCTVNGLKTKLPIEFNDITRTHIADVYRWLMTNKDRNNFIINDVVNVVSNGFYPILLTERREHAVELGHLLEKKEINFQILKGSMRVKERNKAMSELANKQVIVATGKYIGEGFDLPKLDTLILALPISWKGNLVQYVGRIQREFEGKSKIQVYDYVDETLPMLTRMYQKRLAGYKAMGFTIVNSKDENQGNLEL